jgi:3-hydroxyacyl-CoA dehydrogenase/3a,7a,12a-trihydroxy-5b-cholest-24-enoyl-CoA hydratase
MVMYLSHDSCKRSGKIYTLGGGWCTENRVQQAKGHVFDCAFNVDDVARNMDKIENWSSYVHSTNNIENFTRILRGTNAIQER